MSSLDAVLCEVSTRGNLLFSDDRGRKLVRPSLFGSRRTLWKKNLKETFYERRYSSHSTCRSAWSLVLLKDVFRRVSKVLYSPFHTPQNLFNSFAVLGLYVWPYLSSVLSLQYIYRIFLALRSDAAIIACNKEVTLYAKSH